MEGNLIRSLIRAGRHNHCMFTQDDVLTVIRRVDENWAEGMLADKIGIFPISYVEVSTVGLLVRLCPRCISSYESKLLQLLDSIFKIMVLLMILK